MINISKEITALKNGEMSIKEVAEIVLKNNSVFEIAESLVEAVMKAEDYNSPIVISQSEYNKIMNLFKVRGIRPDGTIENRGSYTRRPVSRPTTTDTHR